MSDIALLMDKIPADTRAVIIDDSKPTRRIFGRRLKRLGVEYEEFSRADEALEYLSKEIGKFSVIFCDINMPYMDGFEFCDSIQHADWYDRTPVVIVSTHSDASSVIRALKLGADDYVPKPIDVASLAQVIGRVTSYV